MKFIYTYNGQAISKQRFEDTVTHDWQKEVEDGTYSYGYYRATLIENN